jgi:hypothetical protein
MDLVRMSEHQRSALRKQCLRSLFDYCLAVSGYDDIIESLHGRYCEFLGGPAQRKQVTMPRTYVKTWIGSIAFPQWATLPRIEEDEFPYPKAWEDRFWQLGPNMRILIASYVISNAEKMIGLTRKTYESNAALQILFPEVIPTNFNKTRWSNESACINRPDNFTESTFEAAGIGGASISRHYDLIVEDDLVYAKKDDLSGKELQPSQDDIDKAIKLGLNWPMGPLMLLDYIGSDTTLAIAEVLTEELDPKFHPSTGLKQMVKAQLLGRKTGKGFYDWTQK